MIFLKLNLDNGLCFIKIDISSNINLIMGILSFTKHIHINNFQFLSVYYRFS